MAKSLPDDEQAEGSQESFLGHLCVFARIFALLFGITTIVSLAALVSVIALPPDHESWTAAVLVIVFNGPIAMFSLALLVICARRDHV